MNKTVPTFMELASPQTLGKKIVFQIAQ